ncbi:hypothetical protein [Acidihalobacter ferrooxydans]|uniref:Uncharacterized protein n=1 Tax=Acidihalobacter ferrooxydans TaxID=1765967 RepID=A0A1P8UFT8_9GAMM|nr:hypothetical protein [Acidihalobacter ferrooxydans]APZ42624.1 hypothetical protein BW247_05525 [Acidihalobacter ferrooxydans]
MKKTAKMVTMSIVFASMAMGITTAEAAMPGKATSMEKMHMYFVHHNFGFARNFYQFHPGPHWDLMHASALHLTAAQIKREKMLTMSMMHDTKQGIAALKSAYRQYREYAKQPNPSIRVLIHDVQAVGRAQAYLGYEMIPYHMKGYRLLDPAQRVIYHRLAHENWIRMMKK